MPRLPIALALPQHPGPNTTPAPAATPLQSQITDTLQSTDYDLVCLPITNLKWQERWDRLCLRPLEEDSDSPEVAARREKEREAVDREADIWRRDGGLRWEELNVTRLEEAQQTVGLASDWLELDSEDEGIRFDSELALRSEYAHALYLSLPTFVIPAPSLQNRAQLPSYARAVADLLQMGGTAAFTQIAIRIPISDPAELIGQGPAPPSSANGPPNGLAPSGSAGTGNAHKRISSLSTRPASVHQSSLPVNMRVTSAASSTMSARSAGGGVMTGDPSSTWEMWDTIRTMCGYHPRLSLMLDLTNPLPPSVGALSRWTSELVKQVWLPAQSFIANAKGYPVLSKACQVFLKNMSKHNPTFILAGTHLSRHSAGGPNAYLQYVRHITSQSAGPSAPGTAGSAGPNAPDYTNGYADYLQAPLQPLMDDLGSATYEVFERDPVKYRQYEEAIHLALMDLPERRLVVTVAGAGRGPLVDCALRAMKRSGRQAMVYAVEKNTNAFSTLQERKALEWRDAVQIFPGDMRTITLPEQADILVSELLGSFGDNELSPECLDGAMRLLKPEGISIPASYTAHLAPISSSKLHANVAALTQSASAAETPYVVMMQAVNILSGDAGGRCGEKVQQCWQFEHPRRDLILDAAGVPLTNSHNTRSALHTFSIPHAGLLHGLAGYFESHLYSNIGLSIHPENSHRVSPDMYSWFPLFFPLRDPLYLPAGAELEVSIWRLWDTDRRRIWYEWSAEAFLPTSSGPLSAGGIGRGQSENALSPSKVGSGSVASPMMDAPNSPGQMLFPQHAAVAGTGRVKIGQTRLHNPGGQHSWVGL